MESLENQLKEQEDEANKVISQWQDSCTAAEERYDELEKELEIAKANRDSLQEKIETDKAQYSLLEAAKRELEAKILLLDEDREKSMPLGSENEELKSRVGEFEQELKEAKETIANSEGILAQWEGKLLLGMLEWSF